ncbi:RNA polymerase sigma factor RpoD/SigA [Pedobacter nyackensis]|uniref:sigma-70 family RNA polymerase sigma factor n=1 Tax=Pedobacter nyackensis TaxID=475255 RepID=UPI0029300C6B|nr:RNA polymerase sigma factor RpoD/SigA [Pedobacter nyackensis]
MKEIKIERSVTNRSSDSVDRYLRDLGRYPLLDAEEEAILAKKIRSGDGAALEKLVNCNLRFVVSVAKKYELPGMSLADLISEGNIGLVKAAERFDETKGFKFISYAVWWIRQAILHSIGLHKRMIRLPMNQLKTIADFWNVGDLLEQRLQRRPTLQEISKSMELPYERIFDCLSYLGYTYSFDGAINDDDQECRVHTMEDPTSIWPDSELERDALRINIEMMMNVLSPREKEVIRMAYGMGGGRPLENVDIGEVMGLSSETIRRAKGKAMFRLREISGIEMMQQYL